ncbi:MAG TPA: glycosyltransferase family 39 protein [Acidimicrobiales bacterium]|nr:glycosyltransferase family 39 protein [Acidimicrobiales bacterium]
MPTRRTLPWFAFPLGAFVASRLVTVLGAFCARYFAPGNAVARAFTETWDAGFYITIAEDGYPSTVPEAPSVVGFFPLYPLLARAVAAVVPGVEVPGAGLLVTLLAGAGATLLVWQLANRTFDRQAADRAALLFCFFPGSYALSMVYTEGVFILCAAACLLLLEQRRWWPAALVAGVGSAARPTGFVLALTCAFAAGVHWRRTREWKPLLAVPLAAAGFVAFLVYLQLRVGDWMAYRRVQERWWEQGVDLGATTLRRTFGFLLEPKDDFNVAVSVVAFFTILVLGWVLVRTRPPGVRVVYTAAVLAPVLLSTTNTLTARSVLSAFPLFVGLAGRLRWEWTAMLVGLFGGILAVFMLLIGPTLVITP